GVGSLVVAFFARHRARRRRDPDGLTPVDVVVDPLGGLLAPLALARFLRLVLRLALQLFRALVGAESSHGDPFRTDAEPLARRKATYQGDSGESTPESAAGDGCTLASQGAW